MKCLFSIKMHCYILLTQYTRNDIKDVRQYIIYLEITFASIVDIANTQQNTTVISDLFAESMPTTKRTQYHNGSTCSCHLATIETVCRPTVSRPGCVHVGHLYPLVKRWFIPQHVVQYDVIPVETACEKQYHMCYIFC